MSRISSVVGIRHAPWIPSCKTASGTTASVMSDNSVVAKLAERAARTRVAGYQDDIERLLQGALDTMRRCGTTSRPRVADIVAAAGLSNDAFYRHFSSKDDLVAALLEDGTQRLASYLTHQMSKAPTPEAKIATWVDGVLSQAIDPDIAATTIAVVWNADRVSDANGFGMSRANAMLSRLIVESFTELGNPNPELAARLATHAVVGCLHDHLWKSTSPRPDDVQFLAATCVAIARC